MSATRNTPTARITLEQGCTHAPLSITCGVCGWMFHTRYFGTVEEAEIAYEAMKVGLEDILAMIPLPSDPDADAKCSRVVEAIQDFVARFP